MARATLKDILLELWLRERNEGTITWTDNNGKETPIKDLSKGHLRNIALFLIRKQEEHNEIMDHLGDMDPLEYYD